MLARWRRVPIHIVQGNNLLSRFGFSSSFKADGLVRVNSLDSEEVGTQNISAQRDEPDPADRIRTVNVEIAFSKRSSRTEIVRLCQL